MCQTVRNESTYNPTNNYNDLFNICLFLVGEDNLTNNPIRNA